MDLFIWRPNNMCPQTQKVEHNTFSRMLGFHKLAVSNYMQFLQYSNN